MDRETAGAYADLLEVFVGVTFRAALGAVPLLFSLNTVLFADRLGPLQVAGGAVVVAIPVAVEYTASSRDIERLEGFAGAVILLWVIIGVGVILARGLGIPPRRANLVGLVLVFVAYALAYVLNYTAWGRRFRGLDDG